MIYNIQFSFKIIIGCTTINSIEIAHKYYGHNIIRLIQYLPKRSVFIVRIKNHPIFLCSILYSMRMHSRIM